MGHERTSQDRFAPLTSLVSARTSSGRGHGDDARSGEGEAR